jgi:hypothetical protein
VPATTPLANFLATGDGDIGPGSRTPCTLCSTTASTFGCEIQEHLLGAEIAAHGGIVDPGAIGGPW